MSTNTAESSKKINEMDEKNDTDDVKFINNDKLQEMTSSYSEISLDSQSSPPSFDLRSLTDSPDCSNEVNIAKKNNEFGINTRPDCLNLERNNQLLIYKHNENALMYDSAMEYLQSQGTVMKEGDLVLFVAEDLENKIKLSSPITKKTDASVFDSKSSISHLYRQALVPQLPALNHNVLNELENEARKVATSVDSITENLAAILHSISALTVGCLETYRDAVCKTCDTIDYNIKSMYQLMAKCEELSKSMCLMYKKTEKIKDMKKMLEMFENTMSS